MKTTNAILLILTCAMMYSCSSSAQVNGGKRKVDSFTKIVSSAGIDVNFTQGNSHTVEIQTDAENLNKIEVIVKNGTLELKKKEGTQFKKQTKIMVYVSAKTLDALAFSGGADFFSKEITNSNTFSIAISGGADITIDKLNVNECNIAISGGADADIKSLKASTLNLAGSGGSDAAIHSNNINNMNVAASGGADITITGEVKSISVKASGGADIDISNLKYETISSNKSGGGDIKK